MASSGLNENLSRSDRRRGLASALIAAAAIFVVLLVQSELGNLLSFLAAAGIGTAVTPADYGIGAIFTVQTVVLDLSFVVGVLLVLWLLEPIESGLRLQHVIIRSLIATVGGAVLLAVVQVVVSIYGAFAGPLMAMTAFDGSRAGQGVIFGIADAGRYLISDAPLVVLVGVLVWIWLRRQQADAASRL